MNGVESVPNVDRNVNPIRVLIECGADGMSDKLKARAAGNANLNRPRGTAWLVRGRGRARRRRLQVRFTTHIRRALRASKHYSGYSE